MFSTLPKTGPRLAAVATLATSLCLGCIGFATAQTIAARDLAGIYNEIDRLSPITLNGCTDGAVQVLCEYRASPETRLVTTSDGPASPIREVGVYLPPADRSATDAAYVLTKLLTIFSPGVAHERRQDALRSLVAGAAGFGRRGEAVIDRVRYVLRANDGRNIRIYVTVLGEER